ncbi:hypothetical protein Cantr_05758 [Candida viswanathii]|uniref:Uncharacterized protein n=1 Tax=Candida viswanathii TaxID=5486 RepID=A0A367XRC8_9ASCO|nr:hypothetical protein Cantr_05758 [Candida viswanathii]
MRQVQCSRNVGEEVAKAKFPSASSTMPKLSGHPGAMEQHHGEDGVGGDVQRVVVDQTHEQRLDALMEWF